MDFLIPISRPILLFRHLVHLRQIYVQLHPRQRPQDEARLGVVDIQPVLAQHADLEGDLSQPVPGQAAQVLGASIPHLLEKLLDMLDVFQLHIGEVETVHGVRVLGVDFEGLAQIIKSLQAITFLAEDAPRFMRTTGFLGSVAIALLTRFEFV